MSDHYQSPDHQDLSSNEIDTKGRRLRFFGALFIMLGVPATLTWILFAGFGELNQFDEPTANFLADPIEAPVFDTLFAHRGDTLTPEILEKKAYIAHFWDSGCDVPCEPTLNGLAEVAYAVSKYKHFRILSHNTQPSDISEMWQIARRQTNRPAWHFVWGDTAQMSRLADDYGLMERSFVFGNNPREVALIDREGMIRGYYDPSDSIGYLNLVHDIVHLLKR